MSAVNLDPEISAFDSPQAILATYLQAGEWLTLETPPSQYAANEALILVQLSESEWLTWVPEYGEYLINL